MTLDATAGSSYCIGQVPYLNPNLFPRHTSVGCESPLGFPSVDYYLALLYSGNTKVRTRNLKLHGDKG